MPWEHVKQLIDMQTGERMRRSYPVQIAYEQHKVWAKQQYGSGAEYLVQTALAEFINKTKADGFDAKSPLESSDFMFRANDFPYYFGDGAEHWVMWCTKRLEPGFEAPVVAVKAIEQRFGQDVEWRYLVNSVEHQSVREISHAHIFIKRV
ncbi:hypothetical protein H4S02_002014 [Coemansia sp. RSA 2611]|nr:hypothetical protein LPJ70_001291 [Coemansia sp. RSA 2708]KAJ2317061.1 hypothetical protein IWW52_003325 [Coemansia sp. RSA 2704]KAJ2390142.1 hypothetical protein H4S02_002014 [Coemansia sp. RSA 2611]